MHVISCCKLPVESERVCVLTAEGVRFNLEFQKGSPEVTPEGG